MFLGAKGSTAALSLMPCLVQSHWGEVSVSEPGGWYLPLGLSLGT